MANWLKPTIHNYHGLEKKKKMLIIKWDEYYEFIA